LNETERMKKCKKCGTKMIEAYFYDETRGRQTVQYCPKGCNRKTEGRLK